MQQSVPLHIFSDPICPWCHIGKARPNHPFRIEWHPFQLNPKMPAQGRDRRADMERKFGARSTALWERVIDEVLASGGDGAPAAPDGPSC